MKYLCTSTFFDSGACQMYRDGVVYDLNEQTVKRFEELKVMKRFETTENAARVEPELDYSDPIDTPKRRGRTPK